MTDTTTPTTEAGRALLASHLMQGDHPDAADAILAIEAEARSVPTPCATCGHYADGHDFTPPNDCHATPTCDCETGYVPTRPDEPLTVERLTAALVKVGGLHRYTWEEYATAIIAALAPPGEGER